MNIVVMVMVTVTVVSSGDSETSLQCCLQWVPGRPVDDPEYAGWVTLRIYMRIMVMILMMWWFDQPGKKDLLAWSSLSTLHCSVSWPKIPGFGDWRLYSPQAPGMPNRIPNTNLVIVFLFKSLFMKHTTKWKSICQFFHWNFISSLFSSLLDNHNKI